MTDLAANVQHLTEVNPLRPLVTLPCGKPFYRDARRATEFAPFEDPPEPADIRWEYSAKAGGFGPRLGRHYAWPWVNGLFPKLTCSFWVKAPAGGKVGVVLCVAPGDGSPTYATASQPGVYDDTTFTEHTLTIPLTAADLRPTTIAPVGGRSTAPPDESVTLNEFTVYLGAYNSLNDDGQPAYISCVSLYLRAPV